MPGSPTAPGLWPGTRYLFETRKPLTFAMSAVWTMGNLVSDAFPAILLSQSFARGGLVMVLRLRECGHTAMLLAIWVLS